MTESKLLVLDAMANAALRQEALASFEPGEKVTAEQTLAEFEAVMVTPAKTASALIAPKDLKAPKVTDARSPATMQRAALALLTAAPELDPETAVPLAMSKAGVSRETFGQMMESPDWMGTVARVCQQYLVVTHLPKIIAAQVKKAGLGDSASAKLLLEMFGKSDYDRLDEQTKALAEADPSTRLRHVKAIIDDLQRMVSEQERAGASDALVVEARAKAIADATERKKGTNR